MVGNAAKQAAVGYIFEGRQPRLQIVFVSTHTLILYNNYLNKKTNSRQETGQKDGTSLLWTLVRGEPVTHISPSIER